VEGRSLFHVMDKAMKPPAFRSCPPPSLKSTGGIHWVEAVSDVVWVENRPEVLDGRGLLPVDNPFCTIQCLVVYSASGWAHRQLTVKELLGAYDHSELLVPQFQKVEMCTFVASAPGRLFSTKSDEAKAHTRLWDQRVLSFSQLPLERLNRFEVGFGISSLDSIRAFLLRVWRRRVCLSLLQYLREIINSGHSIQQDLTVERDALLKVAQATWWEWPGGFTPFFWWWPPYAKTVVIWPQQLFVGT